ncbi:hypothetical protein HH308_15815 [Gordonia sp. TBRC 11910]|uniref:DUF4236 domain-containing protein n=1 Tax=Gordonia asplenii TaxID=2725283 RepID=A0A848KWK2_9ACTN|nr:hypothetical protein [Gordonia asplenii]NMO02679.1 hypothetical protein [Gordonia asplenii]
MAFSVRVAPGVSLRASDRGVGVSVVGRGTEVRAGSDGAGISSTVGGMTVHTSIAPKAPEPTTSGSFPIRTVTSAFDALAKRRDDRRLADLTAAKSLERVLLSQHLQSFTPTRKPGGINPWLTLLSTGNARIDQATVALFNLASSRDRVALVSRQQEIRDAEWAKVVAHEPFTVIALIEKAFDDVQIPCTCIDAGTDGEINYATVAVLLPGTDIAGPVRDAKTDKIRRRTSVESADFYASVLASTVVGTAKAAFAASPSTAVVRIVVLRSESRFLRPSTIVAIYASSITRADAASNWRKTTPELVVFGADDVRMNRRGQNLAPLDAGRYPDLAAVAELFGTTLARH